MAVRPVVNHRGGLAFALAAMCVLIVGDLIGTLVFASWLVTTFYPVFARLSARMRAPLAALLLTFSILVVIVGPLAVVAVILTSRLIDLVNQVMALWQNGDLSAAAASLLRSDDASIKLSDLSQELARAAPGVLASVGKIFQVLSGFGIRAFLFVLMIYGLFVHGQKIKAWALAASPFDERTTATLAHVYAETGRGILSGVFLVMILHGIVATGGYAIVGIGRAAEFGALTAVAGLVPAIGTGLVWIPMAAVLAVTGHTGQAVGVSVVGLVVGGADNLLRPMLSRLGRVPLETLPLFIAFFGGISVFGPSGLLLGPIVFAWAKAAIALHVEQKAELVS